MDITKDIKALRQIMPQAIITASSKNNYMVFECDLRHAKITCEEHDALFAPIKAYFGDRLKERYSHHTGYFDVYVRPTATVHSSFSKN